VPVNPFITGKTLHVDGGALWARPGTSETNRKIEKKEEAHIMNSVSIIGTGNMAGVIGARAVKGGNYA
jgi:hypothetical protein